MKRVKFFAFLLAAGIAASPALVSAAPAGRYYGSAKSQVFHYGECLGGNRIKDANLIVFSSRENAASRGYRPCKKCLP